MQEFFDIGRDGTLVYVPTIQGKSTLVWVDRAGRQALIEVDPAMYRQPRLGPDGTRAAVAIASRGEIDVWVYDIDGGPRTRLTGGGRNVNPLWTPNGERVAFTTLQGLFWAPADGSGEPELLLARRETERQTLFSWSSDGQSLAFGDGGDVWLLPLGGESVPVLTTAAQEIGTAFSPNGRWLAYASDESGRDEIYVQPYPEASRRWTISTNGGRAPLWSPQGDELYYRHENRVMVVPVETEPTFSNGAPRMLFEGSYLLRIGSVIPTTTFHRTVKDS